LSSELQEKELVDVIEFAANEYKKYSGEEFAMVSSASVSNEDSYAVNKFAREVMGSTQVTNSAESLVSVLNDNFDDLFSSEIKDLSKSKSIVLLGADLEETHPVAAYQIHKAVNYNDATLIGIGPEQFKELGRAAQLWLNCKDGSEPLVLEQLSSYLIDDDGTSKSSDGDFLESTGLTLEEVKKAADLLNSGKKITFVNSAKLSDSFEIIEQLGSISKLPNLDSTVLVFRSGESNSQGVSDMSLAFKNDSIGDIFHLDQFIENVMSKRIKAVYWVGGIPDISDDKAENLYKALAQVEFLVVQGVMVPDRLISLANVVLPTLTATESTGTYTNVERRLQLVNPIIDPVVQADPVWATLDKLARVMDRDLLKFNVAEDVFNEMSGKMSGYDGYSYDSLRSLETGPLLI
jgi:formate dehydrogenase major subunit